MKLLDIIQPQEILNRDAISDVEITSLCFDSREATKGCVFFALHGTQVDGASYIAEAVKRGASAVVCVASSVPAGLSVPVVAVKDPREILALAASRYYHEPTRSFYLCGVTGTCGKTTITYLLEKIWGEKNSGVVGTVNIRCGGKVLPTSLTTPDPLTLQSSFAKMKEAGIKRVVSEVSSIALQQKRVWGSEFDSAVFTNLTQEHLDYHKTMEAYFEAKKILFNDLLQHGSKKNRLAMINIDDPNGAALIQELRGTAAQVQTFSLFDVSASVQVEKAQYTLRGTSVIFKFGQERVEVNTNLMGAHNLQNIMVALLVAQHSGVSFKQSADALKQVVVPGRLERVGESGFFVDYAHKPNAMQNVLTTMRDVLDQAMAAPRLGIVFGCGGDRDKIKRPLMGEIAAQLADFVIVTSDNPRTEDPQSIVDQILPGVKKNMLPYNGEKGFLVEVDRRTALQKAVEIARPDDVVIVAGKGHEDYQILGTQKIHFDDREEIEKMLKSKSM